MIVWSDHCKKCQYLAGGEHKICDYCFQTGKSRLKEFGVDKELDIDDRINDLNNRCTHWQDESVLKEEIKRKQYEATTQRRELKKAKGEERERLSQEMYNRRYALYKQGLSDAEIARIENCNKSSIWDWRKRNGLKPNGHKPVVGKVGKRKEKKPREIQLQRMELYKQGYDDKQIAEKLNCKEETIQKWRWAKKLSINDGKYGKFEEQEFLKYYNQGLSDIQIAKRMKCSDRTINRYRAQLGLKSNNVNYYENYRDKLLELYNQGMTDRQIAEQLDKTTEAIRKVRNKMKLPSNNRRN